jgi:hypothetical protein
VRGQRPDIHRIWLSVEAAKFSIIKITPNPKQVTHFSKLSLSRIHISEK